MEIIDRRPALAMCVVARYALVAAVARMFSVELPACKSFFAGEHWKVPSTSCSKKETIAVDELAVVTCRIYIQSAWGKQVCSFVTSPYKTLKGLPIEGIGLLEAKMEAHKADDVHKQIVRMGFCAFMTWLVLFVLPFLIICELKWDLHVSLLLVVFLGALSLSGVHMFGTAANLSMQDELLKAMQIAWTLFFFLMFHKTHLQQKRSTACQSACQRAEERARTAEQRADQVAQRAERAEEQAEQRARATSAEQRAETAQQNSSRKRSLEQAPSSQTSSNLDAPIRKPSEQEASEQSSKKVKR